MNWKKQLYLVMVILFICTSSMEISTPFLPYFLKELGLTDEKELAWWSGLVFGISFFTAFISAPLWGILAERFSQKAMLLRAIISNGIMFLLMGLASNYIELFVYRFFSGLAFGMVPACIAIQTMKTPKEHTGYAMGMMQAAHVGGQLSGPLLGGVLGQFFGFRGSLFVAAGIIFVAMIATLFFLESDKKNQPAKRKRQKQSSSWKENLGFYFSHTSLLFLSFLLFLLISLNRGILPQVSIFVSEFETPGGLLILSVGVLSGITGVANILSSPLLGKLSDRIGASKVLVFSLLGVSIGFLLHSFVNSYTLFLVVRFVTGLAIGGVFPLINSLVVQYSPPERQNFTISMISSFHYLGSLLGTIGIGYLAGLFPLRVVFVLCAVSVLLGMIGAIWKLVLPEKMKQKPLEEKSMRSLRNK